MKNALTAMLAAALVACAAPPVSVGQSPGAVPPSQLTGADVEPTPSPWGWLKMPAITMPKISWPKMPADPLAPIKASARKVGDGSKKAWEGTKELFSFGGGKSQAQPTRIASNEEPPSFWSRVFGRGEQQPEGPQSVAEFMSQPRLDP